MPYLKYWYPSRVNSIVNMMCQAQYILLPMAVAKLAPNFAGSLSAHCVRIPALVQTTSFPWETITIHLKFYFELFNFKLEISNFYIYSSNVQTFWVQSSVHFCWVSTAEGQHRTKAGQAVKRRRAHHQGRHGRKVSLAKRWFPLRFSDVSSRSGLTDFSPFVISIYRPSFRS